MKILVTGATGFVGRHVVRELLNSGHEIIVTSRDPEKIKTFDWFSMIHYIPYDLNDARENLFQYFDEPDAVIHLAWEGLPNYTNPIHIERNLVTNYRFLKTLLDGSLNNLTVVGTCLEYGLQNGCLSEETHPLPITSYGIAKDTLRKFLSLLQKDGPFSLKWLRLFYTYGKGQSEKSLLSQLDVALQKGADHFDMTGGEQLRDYLPIEKVAQSIVRSAVQNEVCGIINCCSGAPISIRKFVEEYLAENGKNIRLNFGARAYPDYEPMAFWGDRAKLDRIFNSQN